MSFFYAAELKQQHSKAVIRVHANTKNLDQVLLLHSIEIQQKERHAASKTLALGGEKSLVWGSLQTLPRDAKIFDSKKSSLSPFGKFPK